MSSSLRFVVGRNTGELWFTTSKTCFSLPEIFGKPSMVSGKAGRVVRVGIRLSINNYQLSLAVGWRGKLINKKYCEG
jgi:hypothetical protein